MNRSFLRLFPMAVMLAAMLLLPAPAQEASKEPPPAEEATPPAANPAPPATPAAPPRKPAPAAEDSETPPDLGENVSADNNVSFPVDI